MKRRLLGTRILAVILLFLFLVSFVTSCDLNDLIPTGEITTDSPNPTENNDQNKNPNSVEEDGCDGESPRITILDRYHKTEYSVLLKIEITDVYDGVYLKENTLTSNHFILLEGVVIDDLYGKTTEFGETVILPIPINAGFFDENKQWVQNYYDENNLKEWFESLSGVYVQTNYEPHTYTKIDDDSIQVQANLYRCPLDSYDILPYVDDSVRISLLSEFLEENEPYYLTLEEIRGMDWLCPDGISCEEFESNIETLLAYEEEHKNQAESNQNASGSTDGTDRAEEEENIPDDVGNP